MLTKLILPPSLSPKLKASYDQFNAYLSLLDQEDLPGNLLLKINDNVKKINEFLGSERQLKDKLYRGLRTVLKLVEQETKLVPQDYYQHVKMLSGMVYFGLPLGLVFGIALQNYAFLPLGLPIGLAIGAYLGYRKDAKARKEHRQLPIKLKLN